MDNSYSIIFVQKTISILSKIVDGIESKKINIRYQKLYILFNYFITLK